MLGPRPLLMIAGREAVTAWMSVEAYQTVTGPKELFWIDGASHVDLYDKPEFVDVAVRRLVSFYRTSLCCDTACAAG
ncbi:alpha/beta hydrolase, partial [Mycolicibacterium sp.]